ncbi:MAG: hypothetical protein HOW97_09980 [Catenulispora sp.]|nr:hypothetical protein [Catenulispora sp.]
MSHAEHRTDHHEEHDLEHYLERAHHGHGYEHDHRAPSREQIEDLRQDAAKAYATLKGYFTLSDNYWQVGCSFDTLTDGLRILGTAIDPGLAQDGLNKYRSTTGYWYDDFAWWSIAAAKAYDPAFTAVFGSLAGNFAGVAQQTWTYLDKGLSDRVHLGAPQVYENRDNDVYFTTPPEVPLYWATPRLDNGRGSGLHGVWQKDMFAIERKRPEWTGPTEFNPNPSQPGDAMHLGPYQLTVVNTLYLLNAARFEQARRTHPEAPNCAAQLADEFGFLKAWMGLNPATPIPPGDRLLNVTFGDGSAVVLERVSTYALNNGAYPPVQNWDAQTSWAGDQGLLINGLAAYVQLNPGDPVLSSLLNALLLGYARHLVDKDGVLWPYYPTTTDNKLESWDASDYASGIGVFMRGVLQAARIPGGPVESAVKHPEFQAFLTKAVAWATSAPTYDLFSSLNVLATLLAGIELLIPRD